MRRLFQFAALLTGLMLLVLGGCKKKRPQVPPPQANAPTITTIPQPKQPEPLPPPALPPSAPTATQPSKPKSQPRKKAAKKTPPKPESNKTNSTVREGGSESPGQLSTAQPKDASAQRQNTAQLLAAADSNLRSLDRSLSADEQSMVQQVRAYMNQSKHAEADGDAERAYNLALKARLLSDALVKR